MSEIYNSTKQIYCTTSQNQKKYFYKDGTLKTIQNYESKKLSGESILYWPNGKIKRRCFFKDGIRNGIDEMFDINGTLRDQGTYLNGKPIGVHQRMNAKGERIELIEYLDDVRFQLKRWDDEGSLQVEAIWLDQNSYFERAWDRFNCCWVEKKGCFDGTKLIYL